MKKEPVCKSIVIDGTEYVQKLVAVPAQHTKGMLFVICRTYSAGVFAGYLKEQNGKEVVLLGAIRVYYWEGAASLSQLAMEGTTKPSGCKFAMPVISVRLTEVIETLECTEQAFTSITSVKSWKV